MSKTNCIYAVAPILLMHKAMLIRVFVTPSRWWSLNTRRTTNDAYPQRCLEVCQFLYKKMLEKPFDIRPIPSAGNPEQLDETQQGWFTFSAKSGTEEKQDPITLAQLHTLLRGAVCSRVAKWARTLTCYLGRWVHPLQTPTLTNVLFLLFVVSLSSL